MPNNFLIMHVLQEWYEDMWNKQNGYASMCGNETMNIIDPVLCIRLWLP